MWTAFLIFVMMLFVMGLASSAAKVTQGKCSQAAFVIDNCLIVFVLTGLILLVIRINISG